MQKNMAPRGTTWRGGGASRTRWDGSERGGDNDDGSTAAPPPTTTARLLPCLQGRAEDELFVALAGGSCGGGAGDVAGGAAAGGEGRGGSASEGGNSDGGRHEAREGLGRRGRLPLRPVVGGGRANEDCGAGGLRGGACRRGWGGGFRLGSARQPWRRSTPACMGRSAGVARPLSRVVDRRKSSA